MRLAFPAWVSLWTPRHSFGALLAVALLAAIWRVPTPETPRFAVPALVCKVRNQPAQMITTDLPMPTPSAHASMLEPLADGSVLAAWFGGSREGANDVSIYMARWYPDTPPPRQKPIRQTGLPTLQGHWSTPWQAIHRETLQSLSGRVIRKLGNPVLKVDELGQLHLLFVTVSYGGWAGSSLFHAVSHDGGQSWEQLQKLVTSPFLNISTLVRNPPLWLADGSLAVPVYHEFIHKHPEWLRLDAEGRVLGKTRIPQTTASIQPAAVALDSLESLIALRDAGHDPEKHVRWASSQNAGAEWEAGAPRSIPNPDSAVALLRLDDASLLIAANPLQGGRNVLSLYRSIDGGEQWERLHDVENSRDTRDEFSYPALAQDHNGLIHLSYTYKRQGIRHRVFNPRWLTQPSLPLPVERP